MLYLEVLTLKKLVVDLAGESKISVSTGTLRISAQHSDFISNGVIIKPGDIVQGDQNIFVFNSGDNNLRYRIVAGWLFVPPTTGEQAHKAKEKLYAVINKLNTSTINIFTGPLSDLLYWPPEGRFLPPYATEELQFFLSLPIVVVDLPPSLTIKIELTFIAEQA